MFNQPRLYMSRKIQIPRFKRQGSSIPKLQNRESRFGICYLEFRWCLLIGIWCFLTKKRDTIAGRTLPGSCGDVLLPVKCASSSGALAQLVRAPPCHGGGCGFEPRRLRIPQRSSPHDVNGKNAALMTREQVIDKIAND